MLVYAIVLSEPDAYTYRHRYTHRCMVIQRSQLGMYHAYMFVCVCVCVQSIVKVTENNTGMGQI